MTKPKPLRIRDFVLPVSLISFGLASPILFVEIPIGMIVGAITLIFGMMILPTVVCRT